jgi:hypothetical protein
MLETKYSKKNIDINIFFNKKIDALLYEWAESIPQCGHCDSVLFAEPTEYTELQPLLSGVHSVMMVNLVLASEGGGVHAHPVSLHLPSPVKLQCTLQLSGQIH